MSRSYLNLNQLEFKGVIIAALEDRALELLQQAIQHGSHDARDAEQQYNAAHYLLEVSRSISPDTLGMSNRRIRLEGMLEGVNCMLDRWVDKQESLANNGHGRDFVETEQQGIDPNMIIG